MYSFRASLVGGNETERAALRRMAANVSLSIDSEFEDIDKLLESRPSLSGTNSIFLVKVNSAAHLEQVARLNRFFAGRPILAFLNEDSNLAAVLNVQRAGAAQVLLLPVKAEQLRAALDAVARQFGSPVTTSKVVAVLGASEGCGSTTLAINLADAISDGHGKSCILAELSYHIGRLSTRMDIVPAATITDLLAGAIVDVNAVTRAMVRVRDRLHVLTGPHLSLDRRTPAAGRAAQMVGTLRGMADLVILDMPYTFDDAYFEALNVVDQVVLVARANVPSLAAAKVLGEAVARYAPGATQHLVMDCYGPRAEELTEERIRATLATDRIWTIANDPAAFESIMNSGRFLHQEFPRSPAWTTINALAGRLLGDPDPTEPNSTTSWSNWIARMLYSPGHPLSHAAETGLVKPNAGEPDGERSSSPTEKGHEA